MERRITGFRQDVEGDWVADLDCLHAQHVRHQPPFRVAEWVITERGRTSRIGTRLECPLCDRFELPDDLEPVRTTPEWTAETIPPALSRQHRLAAGMWGILRVHRGQVRFAAALVPEVDVVVGAGRTQVIPPEVEHRVELLEPDTALSVEILSREGWRRR